MGSEYTSMAEVVSSQDVLDGAPRIEGTRIGVLHVHELVVDGDHDPADVADQLDLPLDAVYAALAYYYAHPEEMRTVRQRQSVAEETLRDRSLKPPKTAE